MSMNFTGSEPNDPTATESESLFAATPVWERSGKTRRRPGVRKAAPAAATAAPAGPTADQLAARDLRAQHLGSHSLADATFAPAPPLGRTSEAALAAGTPIYASRTRTTTARRSNGMAPLAVAAGVLVVGGLAAAGWYATRDDGVAELTPGGVATRTAALETAPLVTSTAAPPAVTRSTTTTVRSAAPAPRRATSVTTTRTVSVRTRPAPASSATDAGANAAATLPVAPMPYSSSADATAPATATPGDFVLTPSPVEPTPAPSTSSATPEPSTSPDTSTATPPVTSDPTP